jgi:hypothetical protein
MTAMTIFLLSFTIALVIIFLGLAIFSFWIG